MLQINKQELLAKYITQDVLSYLMEDEHIDWDEAMRKFYLSVTFEKLNDFETGLYLESSSYVYSILCDELVNGKFIQFEILQGNT